MIDRRTTVSYAQYHEDLIMLALLHGVKKGFYVDVGASFPRIDSVTKLFYDKGWRGINIEPIKGVYEQLKSERPEDINVNCGVGAQKSSAEFREYLDIPGHSTFDKDQKDDSTQSGNFKDYEVNILTLKDIFKTNNVKHIDFLKIDVEGFEQQVIDGGDWTKYRPYVVCIEANHVKQNIQTSMKKNSYKLFIADGLNEYYIAEEKWDSLTDDFAERAVYLSHYSLRDYQNTAWTNDIKEFKDELKRVNTDFSNAQKMIEELQSQILVLEDLATLSLKHVSMTRRIKRAAYGLTIDWLREKAKS